MTGSDESHLHSFALKMTHPPLELNLRTLPRSDYHIIASEHRIGARFAYCYRSCVHEAEDGKYKKDVSDYFCTDAFLWDVSRGVVSLVEVSTQRTQRSVAKN